MSGYIKIPVTQEIVDDLAECDEAIDGGGVKDCSKCSLNLGEYSCLNNYEWVLDDPEHPASSEGSVFIPVEKEV